MSFAYTALQLATWETIQLVEPYFIGVIVYLMNLLLFKGVFGLVFPIVGGAMIRPKRKVAAVWTLLISSAVGLQVTLFYGLGLEGVLWGCLFIACAGIVTQVWQPTVKEPEKLLSGKQLPPQ